VVLRTWLAPHVKVLHDALASQQVEMSLSPSQTVPPQNRLAALALATFVLPQVSVEHAAFAVHEPVAANAAVCPFAVHAPGLTQVKPLAAVIVQVVSTATFAAPLAQFVPVHDAAPLAIVGTVQTGGFSVHEPVAANAPLVHKPGLTQVCVLAAVIVQVMPDATFAAPLAQFVPAHAAAPLAIVGTVQGFSEHEPVAANVPSVHKPGFTQV